MWMLAKPYTQVEPGTKDTLRQSSRHEKRGEHIGLQVTQRSRLTQRILNEEIKDVSSAEKAAT
jgi:hypothetical protein